MSRVRHLHVLVVLYLISLACTQSVYDLQQFVIGIHTGLNLIPEDSIIGQATNENLKLKDLNIVKRHLEEFSSRSKSVGIEELSNILRTWYVSVKRPQLDNAPNFYKLLQTLDATFNPSWKFDVLAAQYKAVTTKDAYQEVLSMIGQCGQRDWKGAGWRLGNLCRIMQGGKAQTTNQSMMPQYAIIRIIRGVKLTTLQRDQNERSEWIIEIIGRL
eukprot:TRINITY_DN6248_c0_g1_i1.p1 TRINITY_DN6248_c0_g1~~TRINITY_DN6248_c0_g1_i1.p1  ORF type:complete len:215 (-),score=10.26 TRINITY_DN6248_c0_g1_i1:123-767(-)